nr:biliverdin-producing heme oxygenase [Solimonas marina]
MRAATRQRHAALDATLPIAAEDAGKAEYAPYVAAMWGWLSGFEQHLWQQDWPATIDATARDGKRCWLEADLQAAGLDPADLPRWQSTLPLDTVAHRYGVAYVIEGAQLGGSVLARRLESRLAPWPMRWLRGYGDATGANWRAFLEHLQRDVSTPLQIEAAAHGACLAFDTLSSWFAARGIA